MDRKRAKGAAREPAFDVAPERSIGYLIRATSRMILAKLQASLEPHGVTLGQYFVLRELWENEGITQRELSARVGIAEPSLVAALDALERGDVVTRIRSKQDRRKIHVYLTAHGRGLRTPLLGHAAEIIDGATADFSAAETQTLRALLQRLKANLGVPAPPD
jgi:MarR family transcriptional regulator, organic hydroperoxide resistance regulator